MNDDNWGVEFNQYKFKRKDKFDMALLMNVCATYTTRVPH